MNYPEEYDKVLTIQDSYEQIAVNFDRVRAKPWKECVDFIQSFDPSSLVLDVGCGTGRHSFASALKGHETIGVDFSKNMLKVANEKKSVSTSSNILHFVLADAAHMPFRNSLFDYILYIATLHNLPSHLLRMKSLREINRVLKAEGKCLISVWKRLQFRFLLKVVTTHLKKIFSLNGDFEVLVPWKVNSSSVSRYFYLYSARQLLDDIKKAGMRTLNISKIKIGARTVSDNYFVTVKTMKRWDK